MFRPNLIIVPTVVRTDPNLSVKVRASTVGTVMQYTSVLQPLCAGCVCTDVSMEVDFLMV